MIPYDKIREHYLEIDPFIMNISAATPMRWFNPYTDLVDWMMFFTPIEMNAWQVIRANGKCPLYPQYPVGRYFLDFGNPYMKIGVECDGKNYHLDKAKDNRRDYDLKELGWKIYRIPGSDCVRPVSQKYYDLAYELEEHRHDILRQFYQTTIEGLINALAIVKFGYKTFWRDEYCDEYGLAHECLNDRLSKPIRYAK